MNVLFCTTCKGRTDHLSRTLPQNLADNPNARFVVLSYNDQDSLASYIQANHCSDMESGRLAFYQYHEDVSFRMAHAKNLAHRLAALEGGEILVNLDADNFTGPNFDGYVMQTFEGVHDIFLWSRMVKDGQGRLPRGISGRIAVTKETFFLTGGYDEKYEAYSPDDKDFNARLRRLGLKAVEINPVYLKAILHTDKMRYREYPKAFAMTEEFEVQHEFTVVNGGKVGCGTVFKNFGPDPIVVAPYPTRVFGIGMHKTATTSLHHAFQILGMKSGHWKNAHWAKHFYRDMMQEGHAEAVDAHYCLCDLPVPMLFKELDKGYPGSKFILTFRDEDKWLDSVRRHFDPKHNKFRSQWDHDPFSHKCHQMLYGRKDFHAQTMLERYRAHNAEVLEYFKGRWNDLLIMNMDNGHGWPELCKFLNMPIPTEDYPTVLPTV